MSQRNSEYARKARDLYETKAWVTNCLFPHLPTRALQRIWECAAGSGMMADVFKEWGAGYFASDIHPLAEGIEQGDFLRWHTPPHRATSIITNPPYEGGMAQKFIEHALRLMEPIDGVVAMLLSSEYDYADTRRHLFADCPAWSKKINLTKRIVWFDGPVPCKPCGGTGNVLAVSGDRLSKCKPCRGKGEKKSGPSENHAWYIWDFAHEGPATLAYAP